MTLPKPLLPFKKQANDLIESGAIKEIFFNGPTYQVKIYDKEFDDSYWTYLEYGDDNHLKDYFCECSSQNEDGFCVHIAASYLEATKKGHPQHEKFNASFFSLLTKLPLEQITINQQHPTEEEAESLSTSLFQEQEEDKLLNIIWEYGEDQVPKAINLHFPKNDLRISFSKSQLIESLSLLKSLPSTLKVHTAEEIGVKFIDYDDEKNVFSIETIDIPKPKEGIALGQGWYFVPDEGFYGTHYPDLFKGTTIQQESFEELFTYYGDLLKAQFNNTVYAFHSKPTDLSYFLEFDDAWNLHITSYLFTVDDLKEESLVTPSFAYIKNKGFFHIARRNFDDIHHTVPETKVSKFIEQEKDFLEYCRGFQVFSKPFTPTLNYRLTSNRALLFFSSKDASQTHSFDNYIYVKNKGFFSKYGKKTLLGIAEDTTIPAPRIADFIRENRELLSEIENFFTETEIVEQLRIDVRLIDQKICLTPTYKIFEEFKDLNLLYFEEFVFIPQEGFSTIPEEKCLQEQKFEVQWIESEHVTDFIEKELPKLQNIISELDPRLVAAKNITLSSSHIEHDQGKYKLQLSYQTEFGEIPLYIIWKAMESGQRYLLSNAGLLDLDEERFFWIAEIPKDRIDPETGIIQLAFYELIRMSAFEPQQDKSVKDLLLKTKELKTPEPPNLKGLQSSLRSYQEVGLNWLWFLYHNYLSGLLCDEMGLGKTHQSMALMVAVHNDFQKKYPGKKPKFLVLCPTSVLFHWHEKLNAFFPEAKVLLFHGRERSLNYFFADCNILLTSYGIWRNEFPLLKQFSFELAVFDEIQAAKNPSSRLYNTLRHVNAKMRVSMTGTPIENNLRDLKALFDLTLPGYLPPPTRFRRYFSRPIEKEGNQSRRKLLHRLISPFFLRRKKNDVLSDLPEKTEEIMHCPLIEDQKVLYKEILEKRRQGLLEQLKESDSPIPYLHIFSVLTHLKQICNHPASYYKTPQKYKDYQSGKWELFKELLQEALDSDQKVVVFSQYLAMLNIIELYLQEQGIEFSSIRGATQDRKNAVYKFNNDKNCKVFVGSLHAAGYGIDLTAGSVVIHYDRWWNAAKEEQATGRTHRIGQVKGVQVFKLVTLGSFEERIDQIISQKGSLLEKVVGFDDHTVIKSFSRDDLISLLQDINEYEDSN